MKSIIATTHSTLWKLVPASTCLAASCCFPPRRWGSETWVASGEGRAHCNCFAFLQCPWVYLVWPECSCVAWPILDGQSQSFFAAVCAVVAVLTQSCNPAAAKSRAKPHQRCSCALQGPFLTRPVLSRIGCSVSAAPCVFLRRQRAQYVFQLSQLPPREGSGGGLVAGDATKKRHDRVASLASAVENYPTR